jgi:hypothetical protein
MRGPSSAVCTTNTVGIDLRQGQLWLDLKLPIPEDVGEYDLDAYFGRKVEDAARIARTRQ